MRHCFFLLLAVLIFQGSFSQKFELGKVSVKELEEKRHALDTSAPAAVLYNKVKSYFTLSEDGFSVIHEFEIRIKIYKKEGLDYANYEVPYRIFYENSKPDILNVSDGVTYNLVNGKIEKTKLTGEGKFKEQVNKYWKTITIALPNVKEGSIVEFKYMHKSENIVYFPTVVFQREIPVNYSEYRTEIPVYYTYKPVLKGFISPETKSEVETAYQSTTVSAGLAKDRASISYKQITTTYKFKDIPALKRESYVDNIDNYRSTLDMELELIRKPDTPDKDISKTWEGVAKTIFEDDNFGKQLKQREYFEGEIKQLLQGIDSREDRINKIFNYVKNRMNWDKKFGIFTDKGVKAAFAERTGNIAEINFILIAMLNSAGVMTRPVLLSTIGNGVAVYPNQTPFNYVIALTELNRKPLLLDAAHNYTTANILPLFALNWSGRALDQYGNSEEINLEPQTVSKYMVNIMSTISKDGKIAGKARINRSDYEALEWREKYAGMTQESYLEKLENNLNQTKIKNYVIENEINPEQSIQQTFEFESDNLVDIIADKMYINPLLFYSQTQNPFSQEERKLPIYFGYPSQKKFTFTIDIPEGYMVESLPQSLSIATGEDVAGFRFNIQSGGKSIQVSVNSENKKMLVSQEFYPILKDYYKKMFDKYSEKIVLKKI